MKPISLMLCLLLSSSALTLPSMDSYFYKEGMIHDVSTLGTRNIPITVSVPGTQTNTGIKLEVDSSKFSTKEKSWFYQPKKDGTPSGEPTDVLNLISKNSAYYLGDTSSKNIYLTFDEGYENGFTGKILDILKENNVKAAFFVTNPYINTSGDLIKRMVTEGHLVCNHSTHHPSMASITNSEAFAKELLVVQNNFENLTGKKMARFFRPPMGKYSELSLKYTEALGYKTIFWSFAYVDWKRDNQPDHDYGKNIIMSRTHPGGIYLLHASSKTNTEILDSVIKTWKSKGYVFKSLNELPQIKNN